MLFVFVFDPTVHTQNSPNPYSYLKCEEMEAYDPFSKFSSSLWLLMTPPAAVHTPVLGHLASRCCCGHSSAALSRDWICPSDTDCTGASISDPPEAFSAFQ